MARQLLDELHLARATLIGLSARSTIALDAALAEPGRVERIVLVGPAIGGYVPKQRPPFTADLIAALQARDYRKASEVLLATPVFAAPLDAQPLVRQMMTENDQLWTIPRELMQTPGRPAIERLEEVKVPTLVLIGEQDVAQKEQADLLGRRIAGARVVVIAGGAHLLNLTSPREFQLALRRSSARSRRLSVRSVRRAPSSVEVPPAGCVRCPPDPWAIRPRC